MKEEQLNEVNEQEVLTNQTEFGEEEPIFAEVARPFARQSGTAEVPTKKKSSLVPVGLFFGSLMLILIGGLMLVMPERMSKTDQTVTEETSTTPVSESPISARITELENSLKQADPIKMELSFPPIAEDIYLDQPKR